MFCCVLLRKLHAGFSSMHKMSEVKAEKHLIYCTKTLKQKGKFESPITQHVNEHKCLFMDDVCETE